MGIIRSIDYGDVGRKKVDAIIMENKKVIAIIEFKPSKNFNTREKKNQAIQQEIEVAKKLKTSLIIATDRQETLWINVETGNSVKDKNDKEIKHSFDEKDLNLQKFINKIIVSINKKNDRILPKKLVDPTDLAKQVWQDIWVASGKSPELCLYTFVELFIFKYLSDLGILTGLYSFDNLFSQYKNSPPNAVLDNYAKTIRPEIKELFPEGLDGTTIINGTVFVNKKQKAVSGYGSVFKRVLERFRDNGKLENIDYDFKSKLFESFLKESISRKSWGQYFTPLKVVRAVNQMAGEPKEGMKICDPACGVGKFPLEFVKDKLDELFSVKNGKIIKKVEITGFDKGFDEEEQKTIILAKANMLIYFCELIKKHATATKEFAKLFNESFVLKTNSILGTLSDLDHENEYDLILTNPPYVMSGSSNLKKEIAENSELEKYYKTNAMGLEGLFMEWIIKALKPNGKGFIVAPDGIFSRQNDKKLRQFILDNCYIDAIISLPINTFFRNSKKTYILALTKKNSISEKQTDPVFTYLVSEIGESRDINRFRIPQDDLSEAVELFQSFNGNKKNFHKFQEIKPDKRCKLWEIEKFKANVNWSIDRWWTKTEQVELNIIKKENIANLNAFSEFVRQASNKLKIFSSLIKEVSKDENSKSSSITVDEIFDLSIGTNGGKLTKSFIDKHQGEIAVYGASKDENSIYGKIEDDLPDIKYFENCLTWNTNGSIGKVFFRKGKFSLSGDVIPLIVKDAYKEDLDLLYLKYNLEKELTEQNFGFANKAGKAKIKDVKIKIPITFQEKFDLVKQRQIAKKYKQIEEIKENIKMELEKIESTKIDIDI